MKVLVFLAVAFATCTVAAETLKQVECAPMGALEEAYNLGTQRGYKYGHQDGANAALSDLAKMVDAYCKDNPGAVIMTTTAGGIDLVCGK